MLDKLFSAKEICNRVLLKGGTSLSKVFGLIEHFTEDIDLILDWNEVTKDDPWKNRSKTQQDRFIKQVNASAREYLTDTFLPELVLFRINGTSAVPRLYTHPCSGVYLDDVIS